MFYTGCSSDSKETNGERNTTDTTSSSNEGAGTDSLINKDTVMSDSVNTPGDTVASGDNSTK